MSARETKLRRAFVERQLALQHERGAASIAAAADALRRAMPPDCLSEVNRLEADLEGKSAEITAGRGEAVAVVAAARERGGQPLAAYRSYLDVSAADRAGLGGFLIGLSGQVQYLLVLLIMLVMVTSIYTTFVFPMLSSLYRDFTVVGDTVNEWILGRARFIWFLILLIAVLVLWAWWAVARVRRRLTEGQALPERLASWPIVGVAVQARRALLALQWILALTDAGVSLAAARDYATARYGACGALGAGSLEASERLGTLRAELNAQVQTQQEDVVRSLARARGALVYLLRFLVYFVIALAVISMYAPIFGLGSVA